ncbi:hypothetical protein Tco_0533443 [Tanacetum coccineum]
MASLGHRLKPLFSIKECMTCGALYTADFCCSKGGLEDKILCSHPPPQLQFETYLCELCGNNVHYGYDCPPQFPLFTSKSQDGKTRLSLVDDLKVFKESHSRQDEEQAQDLTSMITTSIHKIEVYELKTKDKA